MSDERPHEAGDESAAVAERRRRVQEIADLFRAEGRILAADRRKLAEKWGMSDEKWVASFIGRNFSDIFYAISDDRPEGLWFVDAQSRMASRQADAELLSRAVREAWVRGQKLPSRLVDAVENMRANAAKELGQYLPPEPPRPAPVEFHIEVDGASLADIARPALPPAITSSRSEVESSRSEVEPGPSVGVGHPPAGEPSEATPPGQAPSGTGPTSGGVVAPHEEPTPELAPAEEPWVNVFDREEL
ncbi:hypothetical protein [Frankia sp. KB5]|uniref:hypothetical protein n=1 Tax=Frankia sp. KB5 TaxID=683318 RepID=UPI000A103CAE|nr:hypothetical protein [Frankia sp. KB5]ORT48409.1 hypothetical protein KBI5_15760 [Frankia sp. KB5]